MFVQDGLVVDKTWETSDGFLGFSARFARTGIQHYDGSQIDPAGQHLDDKGERRFKAGTLYPVQRDAAEVFAPRAMGSFVAKPVTNDHPSQGVNRDNWGRLAKGAIGEVLRDGEYARMSGLLTDGATIDDYRSGKRELSGGYQTKLIVGDGVNDKGEAFVAKQTAIDGNHVALVAKGRAGPECAIKDSVALCDANPAWMADFKPKEPTMKIKIGDAEVDATNGEAVRIAVDALNTKLADTAGQIVTLTAQTVADAAAIVAKDAELTKLAAELADERDPAKRQARDAARATVVDKAKALGLQVADGTDTGAIMKAVVDKAMGDKAKDYTADHVAIAFEALTKDMKPTDPVAQAFAGGITVVGDAAANEAKAWADNSNLNAWRTAGAAN